MVFNFHYLSLFNPLNPNIEIWILINFVTPIYFLQK